MTWFREHPRATLAIALAVVVAAQIALLLGAYSTATMMALALGPYAALALLNGWVLRMKHRSLHWLWLYLFYNWGGALIPVGIALFVKPSEQPINQQV